MTKNKIPKYVIDWTDRYFHQSAFNVQLSYPKQDIINYLSRYRGTGKVKLYRGVSKYNSDNLYIQSWTYNKNVAGRYISEDGGEMIEKEFNENEILLDTTMLSDREKLLVGYDYMIDDREVLIKRL